VQDSPNVRAPLDELFGLDGQVAVVTGASSGIGVGMVHALANAGAAVVMAARRLENLETLRDELATQDRASLAVRCDVTQPEQVDELLAATLDAYGRVDVLVNNAGITKVVPAETESFADFQQVMDVNLTGVFHTCQRFGRVMLDAEQGSIINVSSILGLVGSGSIPQAAYAASKGAVINMTRELAAQWARRGVRVNGIAPAWFETEMTGEMFEDDHALRWIRNKTPMGRPGEGPELSITTRLGA
jgi:NAD(P)-dependent dehydrogenase (short-subunit alcohol dehydrogenase family)